MSKAIVSLQWLHARHGESCIKDMHIVHHAGSVNPGRRACLQVEQRQDTLDRQVTLVQDHVTSAPRIKGQLKGVHRGTPACCQAAGLIPQPLRVVSVFAASNAGLCSEMLSFKEARECRM